MRVRCRETGEQRAGHRRRIWAFVWGIEKQKNNIIRFQHQKDHSSCCVDNTFQEVWSGLWEFNQGTAVTNQGALEEGLMVDKRGVDGWRWEPSEEPGVECQGKAEIGDGSQTFDLSNGKLWEDLSVQALSNQQQILWHEKYKLQND